MRVCSRFFPAYRISDVPATPMAKLGRAREIGLETGRRYVYMGNVPGEENTYCHECGLPPIRRTDYGILESYVQLDGHCPHCGTSMAGVGIAVS